eukprot:4276679-Prymnesium_polylepis.2
MSPLGVVCCLVSGSLCGGYNVLCRYLMREGLPAGAINSAAVLALGALAVIASVACPIVDSSGGALRWAQLNFGASGPSWFLLCGYCVMITLAQLAFIGGVNYVPDRVEGGNSAGLPWPDGAVRIT